MNRKEKQVFISAFADSMQQAGSVVVANYSGMSVADMQSLRMSMAAVGGIVKVTKNRLAKIAIKDTVHNVLADKLTGQLVFLYAEDAVVSPKVAVDYAKNNEKLELIAGSFDGSILDVNGLKQIASLPPINELRAKLIGIMNAPATKIAGVVQAPAAQLARVVSAYADKGAQS